MIDLDSLNLKSFYIIGSFETLAWHWSHTDSPNIRRVIEAEMISRRKAGIDSGEISELFTSLRWRRAYRDTPELSGAIRKTEYSIK